MPIAGLLDGHDLMILAGVADSEGLLSPTRHEDLVKRINGRPSEVLARCLGALDEGLQGRILEFNQDLIEENMAELDTFRADIAGTLPKGEDVGQMRSVADHLQLWARSIGVSESRIASRIQDATATSAKYVAVISLTDQLGEPSIKLLLSPEWKIVSSALDRSRARTLTFADGHQIVNALNTLVPSWAACGHSVLEAIEQAGRGKEVARAI